MQAYALVGSHLIKKSINGCCREQENLLEMGHFCITFAFWYCSDLCRAKDFSCSVKENRSYCSSNHGLRTPREGIAMTARPRIQSQSQIFRYSRRIFCLPHRPNFSDIFDLCLHWVSIVCASNAMTSK